MLLMPHLFDYPTSQILLLFFLLGVYALPSSRPLRLSTRPRGAHHRAVHHAVLQGGLCVARALTGPLKGRLRFLVCIHVGRLQCGLRWEQRWGEDLWDIKGRWRRLMPRAGGWTWGGVEAVGEGLTVRSWLAVADCGGGGRGRSSI